MSSEASTRASSKLGRVASPARPPSRWRPRWLAAKARLLLGGATPAQSAPGDGAVLDDLAALGRVTAFAPHPDDESLACGGLIARLHRERIPVRIVVMTDGSASHPRSRRYPASRLAALRRKEVTAATRCLGLAPVSDLDVLNLRDSAVPDPASPAAFGAAVEAVAALLRLHGTTTVLAPLRFDAHADHRACFAIIMEAIRLNAQPVRVLEYGVWAGGGDVGTPPDLQVDSCDCHRVDVSSVLRSKKSAIRCHRSQLTNLIGDDPSGFRLSERMVAFFTSRWERYYEFDRAVPSSAAGTATIAGDRVTQASAEVTQVTRIGVVIPFFQREPGLLVQALRSIAAQDTSSQLCVVIVDDGSPVDAEPEIAAVPELASRVTLLRQANAGPAAARNSALDVLASKVDYIAFLDSDDLWTPDHLSRAERAMAAGAEFYFCDFSGEAAPLGAFEQCGFPRQMVRQRRLDADLWQHTSDFVDTLLRYHVGTGTVVYDVRRFPAVRFPTHYRYAHEDTLFWLRIACDAGTVMFSHQRGMLRGKGVNIFASAGWGRPQELHRLRDEVVFCREVLAQFRLTAVQREYITVRLNQLRRDGCLNILHAAARGFSNGNAILEFLRAEPMTLLRLPRVLVQALIRRGRGRLPRSQ